MASEGFKSSDAKYQYDPGDPAGGRHLQAHQHGGTFGGPLHEGVGWVSETGMGRQCSYPPRRIQCRLCFRRFSGYPDAISRSSGECSSGSLLIFLCRGERRGPSRNSPRRGARSRTSTRWTSGRRRIWISRTSCTSTSAGGDGEQGLRRDSTVAVNASFITGDGEGQEAGSFTAECFAESRQDPAGQCPESSQLCSSVIIIYREDYNYTSLPFTGCHGGAGGFASWSPRGELKRNGEVDFEEPQGREDKGHQQVDSPGPFVRGRRRGRRLWLGRCCSGRGCSFRPNRQCSGETHFIGGSVGGGQEEEGGLFQAGHGFGLSEQSDFRRSRCHWQRQKDSSCQESSQNDAARSPRRDTSTLRETDVRRSTEHDVSSGYGNAGFECKSLGRIPIPNREFQDLGSRSMDDSRDSGCPGGWRTSPSTCFVPSPIAATRPDCHRQRQLGFQQRVIAGAIAAIQLAQPASGAQRSRRRTAVFSPFGFQMGRGSYEPPEGARRLSAEEEKCWKTWQATGRSRSRRCRSQEETQGEDAAKCSVFKQSAGCMKQGKVPADFGDTDPDGSDVKVPGISASTVRVPALLNSLPRWLLQLNSGFRGFLLSILQPLGSEARSTSSSSSLWPMPPPYPEVFRSQVRKEIQNAHRKRLVALQVIAFDWLVLNEPSSAPESIRIGRPLNGRQWSAVKMLEHLDFDGNTPEFVEAADMGRGAAKVESFEDAISAVARAITALQCEAGGYGAGLPSQHVSFEDDEDVFRCGDLIGRCASGLISTAKPLVSKRLTFPTRPNFDPRPFFDDRTLDLYDFPISHGRDLRDLDDPPKVQVRASQKEKIHTYKRMYEAGMLEIIDPADTRGDYLSGLFCVHKDAERDRLILDSRPANMADRGQNLWCGSMASATTLAQIHLDDDHCLEMSGEDLKDFFYQFRIGKERTNRNGICGLLWEEEAMEIFGQYAAGREYPLMVGLSTLAMGDLCACEFAQCSHISLCLRDGVCRVHELLSLKGAIPRGMLHVGIIIDDLVVMEKVLRSSMGQGPSDGERRIEAARLAYQRVGLPNNPKKGFLRQLHARFWGAEVDGEKGLLRASSLRLWPTILVTLRVCSLGLATVGLMESLAGCWVSLLGVRRRLFSLLDIIFEPLSIQDQQGIIRLSPEMIAELSMLVILGPLAVVNLRADFANFVAATDASCEAIAGVRAPISKEFSKELSRHTLRKGNWSKLLPPSKAWAREHDFLPAAEELPDEVEEYKVHPLWEIVSRCPTYRESWRRMVNKRHHINVLELKAHLAEERRIATSKRSLRVPFGLDSQVCLGCVVKGRASSKALNKEMRRNLCYPISADIYGLYMYFPSAFNRADGPTRGRLPDDPDLEFPSWWEDAQEGCFEEMDWWLQQHGAGLEELPYGDLCGFNKRDFEPNRIARRFRKEKVPNGSVEAVNDGEIPKAETKKSSLSDEALELLRSLPRSQFIFAKGVEGFDEAGSLDLFSGSYGVARQMVALGCPWVLTYEWNHSSGEDLLLPEVREKIIAMVKAGCFKTLSAAPICSSFSVALTPPIRSGRYPAGIPGMRVTMRKKVKEGNSHNSYIYTLVELAEYCGIGWFVENPDTSWWWRQKRWKAYRSPRGPLLFRLCFCRFGCPWKKPTRIATNTTLAGRTMWCTCRNTHLQLRGTHPTKRIPWTLVAQPYPRGLSRLLAGALCLHGQWMEKGKLNIARCCRANSMRVGEAKNPGPVRQSLEEVHLVRPATLHLEAKLVRNFLDWCRQSLVSTDPDELFDMVPSFLGLALRNYADLMYQQGGALSNLRHLLLGIQRWKHGARPYLHEAWSMVARWELECPVKHRTPIPEALMRAMCSLAWFYGWHSWVGITLIAFYGAGRLGEVIKCCREDLLLGTDLLEKPHRPCFLRLRSFKSLHRQPARIQHMKVSDETACRMLHKVFYKLPLDSPLFGATHYQYRKRWDALLEALHVDPAQRLTPGGLRGGAAVFHYRAGRSINDVMWLLRLRSQQTLESYIQEVAALNTIAKMKAETRSLISHFSNVFPHLAA